MKKKQDGEKLRTQHEALLGAAHKALSTGGVRAGEEYIGDKTICFLIIYIWRKTLDQTRDQLETIIEACEKIASKYSYQPLVGYAEESAEEFRKRLK